MVRISYLVHMPQYEHGASNIWLCSQGTLYDRKVRASRALVSEGYRQLHILFQHAMLVAGGALCHRIAGTVWYLNQLTTLRKSVSGQAIGTQQAVEQYSRTLRHPLGIISQLNDSIDYPHIADGLVALYSFIQNKGLVGQEQALGAIGFTQGKFSLQTRQELVDRIDG